MEALRRIEAPDCTMPRGFQLTPLLDEFFSRCISYTFSSSPRDPPQHYGPPPIPRT
ncbi:hypothetical protein PINS_up020440 [Pythium insidiosum]|nr:hypothetical protein PINS_up020440 [Pythium insidiosum]